MGSGPLTDRASQSMVLREVLGVLGDLAEASCAVWVAGGWGVDALVGRQTRLHRDLDLAVDARNETVALRVLGRRGYRVETDWRPVRVELIAEGVVGSTFTRSSSTQPVTAARPTWAGGSSTIRQKPSTKALLVVCACRACPARSSCSSIPTTNLAPSTCMILPCLSTSHRAVESSAFWPGIHACGTAGESFLRDSRRLWLSPRPPPSRVELRRGVRPQARLPARSHCR